MEQLKMIKDQLISQVESQMLDLRCVDTRELAEVIGMIEKLAKAIYYCEVYKHMEMAEEMEKQEYRYQTPEYYREIDDYFASGEKKGESSMYMHDEREGRSPMKRKMYMESKLTNQDTSKSMRELESYLQYLTADMMELLEHATPEEKTIVQKKVNMLATKIQNIQ